MFINNYIKKYEYSLHLKNREELNKIIEILKVCQPPILKIHHSYRNRDIDNLNNFLNDYYINHSYINETEDPSRFDYYIIKSYKIPYNLTEEEFANMIHILLKIKLNELYIPKEQYLDNFDSNYNKLLSPLLDFYDKKNYNINGDSYYEKRNV